MPALPQHGHRGARAQRTPAGRSWEGALIASSTAANKALVRRLVEEFWSGGNLAAADQRFAPAVLESVKTSCARIHAAFPNWRVTIDEQIGEGNTVVTRWTARGVHQGEWSGVAATGKEVVWTGIILCRLAEGVIVEWWPLWDNLGLLQQFGAIPAPVPAPAP